jgi:hypothetical protein
MGRIVAGKIGVLPDEIGKGRHGSSLPDGTPSE